MLIALSAVAGLLIGSFLTVVVDRVPRGASIVQPGSACGECGMRLGVVDLVPVASWVALRGRCRGCAAAIGPTPLVVELSTAAVLIALAVRFDGEPWAFAAHAVFGAALVAQSTIDLQIRRLPREVTYTAMLIGAPLLCVAAFVDDRPERIAMAALGAAIAATLMGAIHVAARGGMGDGDVRFSPLLGMFLGWQNPGIVPLGLLAGFVLGAVVGVAVMVATGGDRKTAVPFGPFMAAGALLAVFIGQDLVDLVMAR